MKKIILKLLPPALFLMGAVSLLNVIILSFLVPNIHLGYILQGLISAVFMLYGLFFNKIHVKIHILSFAACAALAIFILFLAVYGKTGRVDYTEDVVIVLGAGLRADNEVSPHLARRLLAAIEYFNQNPDALIIVTGGLGAGRDITEAEAMERFLTARGVPPERIIQENRSTSTYENLVFAKDILEGYFPEGFRAVLVTSDFHIYRATRMAQDIGLTVNRRGAHTPWGTVPVNYLREITAVMHMWVF